MSSEKIYCPLVGVRKLILKHCLLFCTHFTSPSYSYFNFKLKIKQIQQGFVIECVMCNGLHL